MIDSPYLDIGGTAKVRVPAFGTGRADPRRPSGRAHINLPFQSELRQKIGYYKALHDHTDLWVSLDRGPVDGDAVFPIALDMLP